MPNLTFQVALQHESGLPEDQFVNVLYFDVAGIDSDEDTCDGIAAVYTSRANFFAGEISGLEIKCYEDGTGSPRFVKSYAFEGGSGNAPFEVACCLSYYADDEANASGRRRGRIYIGPFNAASGSRPDSTLRDMILDMGEEFAQVGFAANTTWKMHSRIDNAYHTIERLGVDDAWDTVRSRGLAPSLREFRDVQ